LGNDLTCQAAAFSRDTSATLTDHILRNVASNEMQDSNIRIMLRPLAVAACIALMTLAGVFFLVQRHYNHSESEISETAATFRNLMGQDLSSGLSRLVEKPLTGELQNIVDDTESAAHFLLTCVAVLDSQSPMLDDNVPTR